MVARPMRVHDHDQEFQLMTREQFEALLSHITDTAKETAETVAQKAAGAVIGPFKDALSEHIAALKEHAESFKDSAVSAVEQPVLDVDALADRIVSALHEGLEPVTSVSQTLLGRLEKQDTKKSS